MDDEEVTRQDLEFAFREYTVATSHLMNVLVRTRDEMVPDSIINAVMSLCHAIDKEWDAE